MSTRAPVIWVPPSRGAHEPWLVARAPHRLGPAAHIAGEYPAALAHCEPALAIWQDLGHGEGIGVRFNVMGVTACRQEDYATAPAHARDGVRALREVGSDWPVHNAVALFATLAAVLGQPPATRRSAGRRTGRCD